MCGIAALSWHDRPTIEAMLDMMLHRGPDGRSVVASAPGMLGQCRLAIVDSAAETGVLQSADGAIALAMNGEVYNYMELRAQLIGEGITFETGTDTEVVLHGVRSHGLAFLARLRGMYALLIADHRRGLLHAVRDPLGVKPLYLRRIAPDRVAFASEIRPLLQLGRSAESAVAMDLLRSYGYIPGPATPFEDVQLVTPGGCVTVASRGRVRAETLVPIAPGPAPWSPATLAGMLEQAVHRVATAEMPMAVLLSGGIDSALVASIARRYAPGLHAFTVAMEGDPGDEEEAEQSEATARRLGLKHTVVTVTEAQVETDLPAIVRNQESPQDRGSVIPKWYVAQAIAAAGIRVALGGSGADEAFGGYRRNALRYAQLRGSAPDGAEAYHDAAVRLSGRSQYLLEQYRTAGRGVDWAQYFDVCQELSSYHNPRLDKTFMAHTVEYRVPMQDVDLVAYALGLPPSVRLAGGETKAALRLAARRFLPEEVCSRPKRALKLRRCVEEAAEWQDRLLQEWRREYAWALKHGAGPRGDHHAEFDAVRCQRA